MAGQGSGKPPGHDWSPGATSQYIASTPPRSPVREVAFGFEARALPGADLWVVSADVREALSEPYEAVVELATQDPTVDLDAMLGARCALEMVRGPRLRRVCGLVRRLDRLDSVARCQRVQVTVVPALWALSQRTDSRIFQELTAPEIVQAVWRAAGLDPDGLAPALTREYLRREYCVQYQETDLAFVSRLLEEEGIAYWFRHDDDEVMVLADSPSYETVPTIDRGAVPYAPPQSALAHVEVIQRLDFSRELRPTGVTLRDHDFTRPAAALDLTRAQPRGDGGPRALYEYPARYALAGYLDLARAYTGHDGARHAEVSHLAQQVAGQVGRGRSNVTGIMPGRVFELAGHERPELDQRYLVTRASHRLRAPEVLNAAGHDAVATDGIDRYRNEYECIPESVPFVPSRRTPRPITLATQTATVVGPPGEEIYVDHHGRIKVEFHWDRAGMRNERSSCWMRVMQPWAGAGWGSVFIPRVGMEVVVTFLEGDPDRPLVTGCVYNGMNRPPYELPESKTRSAIRTDTSPGGRGFNELAFEDRAGAEQVFIHAQRDCDEVVGNDRTTTVAASRTDRIGRDTTLRVGQNDRAAVGGDRERLVGGAQLAKVAGDRTTEVGERDVLTVKGASRTEIHGNAVVEVRGRHSFVVGSDDEPSVRDEYVFGAASVAARESLTLRSEGAIVLQCGDSTIELLPEKIVVRAKSVELHAVDSLQLRKKDGSTVTLDDEVEVLSKAMRVFTEGAALELDQEAKVKGAAIKLGYQPNKPKRDAAGETPPTQKFKCQLTDYHFDPYAGRTYHLMAEGLRFEGTTDGDGKVEAEIPASARQVTLRLWLDEYPAGRQRMYSFRIEELAAASDVAGAKSRLRNLGYYSGPIDGESDEGYTAAVAAFQQDHGESDGLTATGELDGATSGAIERVHGH